MVNTLDIAGESGKPVGIAVAPDGKRVYVANGAAHEVVVIDPEANRVVARIEVGRRPWGVALSPDGRRLYAANGLTNDVSVIGYDDVPMAAWPAYALTTIRQPVNRMVAATVEALLGHLSGDRTPRKTRIDGPLMIRGSARLPEGERP